MNKEVICPVCGSNNTDIFLVRKNVPVHQNFLFFERNDAIDIFRGNLELCVCSDCEFIFNKAFDPKLLNYGELYENTQDNSLFFNSYIEREIEYLVNELGIKDRKVIEVGCGKGNFLRKFIQASNGNGYGFDPSYIGEESILDGKVKYIKAFYDERYSDIKTDIIICRHVIEHISNPIEFLKNIGKSIVNSSHALIFFETPNVNWILENRVIYDFFYEHCSYFNNESLIKAFEVAGFEVSRLKSEFNDQYNWITATINQDKAGLIKQNLTQNNQSLFKDKTNSYTKAETKITKVWKERLKILNELGMVAIWGAGAKGVTFVNLIDPFNKLIDCVIDINPNKQGKYVAGTGHPIVGLSEIPIRKIKTAIIMNPNYRKEIEVLLLRENVSINLVDWEAQDEANN